MNVWNLTPGLAIRIVQSFKDYQGKEFAAGTILHFKDRDYLPYHSGHTVYFEEATMYLCDDDATSAIVENQNNQYYEVV